MKKTIKAVTKKAPKGKAVEETIREVVERVNAEATLIAENKITAEKARRVNPATRAPMTKEEYQAKYNIEGALKDAQEALTSKNLNAYYEVMRDIIVKKAFKMLQKHNITVDIRDIQDMRQDGYTALWLNLRDWKAYKRVEKVDNTEVTYIFESPTELIEEFGIDKGAKILFWVLADRVQKYLRTQIFTETTNRDSAIEAITHSNTVAQLQDKIKVAATIHNIKDRQDIAQDFSDEVDAQLSEGAIVLDTASKLDALLSKPQRKLLNRIALGELNLTDISRNSGNTSKMWKNVKEIIRQGGIAADDMRKVLNWIVKGKMSLVEAEQFDTFTKRGLATILVRMSR